MTLKFADEMVVVQSERDRKPGSIVLMRSAGPDHFYRIDEWYRVQWVGGSRMGPWTVGLVRATKWEKWTRWLR
jgi:hypothetical protein